MSLVQNHPFLYFPIRFSSSPFWNARTVDPREGEEEEGEEEGEGEEGPFRRLAPSSTLRCDATLRRCSVLKREKELKNCAAHILLRMGAGSGIVTFSDPPPSAAATLPLTGGGANMKFPILEIGSAVFVEEGKAGVVTSFRVLPTC